MSVLETVVLFVVMWLLVLIALADFRPVEWLIERAKRTPYYHLDGYMERFWLVPYRSVVFRETHRSTNVTPGSIDSFSIGSSDGTGSVTWRRPIARLLQICGVAALMVFWKSSSVLNLLMSTTMAQCSAFNPSLFGSTWGGLIPFIQTLCVADAAVAPSPRMEEMPAIFKNCLLSMLMICHPPSGRYDNPSSRALRPYSCGIHRRTFSYLHGIACIQSAEIG